MGEIMLLHAIWSDDDVILHLLSLHKQTCRSHFGSRITVKIKKTTTTKKIEAELYFSVSPSCQHMDSETKAEPVQE